MIEKSVFTDVYALKSYLPVFWRVTRLGDVSPFGDG
jgi:hypothetical protein